MAFPYKVRDEHDLPARDEIILIILAGLVISVLLVVIGRV